MAENTVNVTTLKSRGWTDTMIRRLLGTPDEEYRLHLGGRRYTWTKRYTIARVEAAEQTAQWQTWRAKNVKHSAARSLGAMQAADTRREHEVSADPSARQALLPLVHTTARYTAIYSGPGAHGCLLTDVMHEGQLVTDHVWIHDQLTPEPAVGEQFEFSAWADWYRKGYMGWREDVDRERGTRCDIQLTDVRRVAQAQAAE